MKNLEQYKDDLKQLLETGQTLRLAMQLECDPEQVEEVLKRAEKEEEVKAFLQKFTIVLRGVSSLVFRSKGARTSITSRPFR